MPHTAGQNTDIAVIVTAPALPAAESVSRDQEKFVLTSDNSGQAIADTPPHRPSLSVSTHPDGSTTNTDSDSTLVSIPNRIETPLEAPPDYDGPLPVGMALVTVVKLDMEQKLACFDITRPTRLEDQIPNLEYAQRMAILNEELADKKVQRSIELLRVSGAILGAIGVCIACVVAVLFFQFNNPALFAGVGLFFGLAFFVPTTARYIQIVRAHVTRWNEEDKLASRNLEWKVQTVRKAKGVGTLVHVHILVFEEVGFSNDTVALAEYLPTYTPTNRSAEELPHDD
ncbi:hypothetical protein BJ741DRAFT_584091 [Chytriomyces cf. hyalinus JEL632]|nr:hypothetical protein BJ741DRAFT_584091 [Chytriomyces cf. hyalinus JEL632]